MKKVFLFALLTFLLAAMCLVSAFATENVVFLADGGTGDGKDDPQGTGDAGKRYDAGCAESYPEGC